MARTKHASYVDGCDPSHECPSPSHERDDAKERHRRLTVSTRGQRHWSTKLEPEPKPQVKAHPSNRIIGPPFGRGLVDLSLILCYKDHCVGHLWIQKWQSEMKLVSKEVMKILLMTHLSFNSEEKAITAITVGAMVRLTWLADLVGP